jgi:hypothetical protein
VIFPGCAAKAALKATLEKGATERSIIGSNDVATIIDSWSHGRRPKDAPGNVIPTNALERVAWKNETLLTFVYVNLGRTVEHDNFTGHRMNYMRDTFFPEIPAEDRVIT